MSLQPTQLEQTRDEFLSRMSHELRTPLNAVIGFSRVLEANRAGNQRPEDLALLQRVRENGEQLLQLVQDVLDHSRIRRGMLQMHITDTNVADIAATVAARHRRSATEKGVRIVLALPEKAPAVRLDEEQFVQVVRHLVANAVKFTQHGTVNVNVVTDAANRPVRLEVVDTGVGIPVANLARIFEPFEQGDAGMGRSHEGAGLGLPLAHQLCEAMGCRLSVVSDPGTGSRFTIHFPIP
ncbi:MAG: HAMP domain-containing sensor histidine kinase [Gemmatimonadaceae bacterium]